MKPIYLKSTIITILALTLGWLCYICLDVNIFSNLSKTDSEADVLNWYYRVENKSSALSENYTNIVLFDLDGEKSRRKIADAIRLITDAHPQVLILDIIFPKNSETLPDDDRYLEETVASCANLYVACRIDGEKVEHSFFVSPTAREGLTNSASQSITCFRPFEVFNGDTLRYIEYLATGKDGRNNPNLLTNYFNKSFTTIKITEGFIPEILENKYVIVSDLSDLRDKHDLPFRINGQWRAAGAELMAFQLSTLLENNWLVRTPQYVSWIIAAILTFAFAFICSVLNRKIHFDAYRNLLMLGVWFVLIFLLLYISFSCFSIHHIVISPVLSGITLSMAGVATDLLDAFYKIMEHIKNNNKKAQ